MPGEFEVFVPHVRLAIVSPRFIADPDAAAWHTLAHLELGHHEHRGQFTDEMETAAVELAKHLPQKVAGVIQPRH